MSGYRVCFIHKQICARAWKEGHELAGRGHHLDLIEVQASPTDMYSMDYFRKTYDLKEQSDLRSMVLGSRRIKGKILDIIRDNDYDIVHVHNAPDNITAWLYTDLKKMGIPLVHDFHDIMSAYNITFSTPLKRPLIRWLYNRWEKKAAKNASAGLVSNPLIKDYLVKKYGMKDVEVVENRPLSSLFDSSKLVPKLEDGVHFVHISSISSVQDASRYIYPHIKAILEKGSDHHVHIYSRKSEELVKFASGYDNMHLHEPVPQEDLYSEISQYHFGLLLLNEKNLQKNDLWGSYNKMYEYVIAGLPIVTNIPGTPRDFVRNNEYGIYLKDIEEIRAYDFKSFMDSEYKAITNKMVEDREAMFFNITPVEKMYKRLIEGL